MEKIYSYLDIILLALVVIFLLVFFIRLLGKKSGLEKKDLETRIVNPIESTPAITINKEKTKEENIELYAEGSLNFKLNKIKAKDKEFSLKKFINGAKKAFELIVNNFNQGTLEVIKPYVTSKAYDNFQKFKAENSEKRNIIIEDFLIVDVVDAEVADKLLTITVKFLTRQRIDNTLKEINEIWKFTKSLSEDTNIWKLSSIRNG